MRLLKKYTNIIVNYVSSLFYNYVEFYIIIYKIHIAIVPERIITASIITTWEKHDGKELANLIEKSKNNGIEVEAIIGDGAYSKKDNLEYCGENNIKNVSKLSKSVTHGNGKTKEDFEYNKDAGMYVWQDIWQ